MLRFFCFCFLLSYYFFSANFFCCFFIAFFFWFSGVYSYTPPPPSFHMDKPLNVVAVVGAVWVVERVEQFAEGFEHLRPAQSVQGRHVVQLRGEPRPRDACTRT